MAYGRTFTFFPASRDIFTANQQRVVPPHLAWDPLHSQRTDESRRVLEVLAVLEVLEVLEVLYRWYVYVHGGTPVFEGTVAVLF